MPAQCGAKFRRAKRLNRRHRKSVQIKTASLAHALARSRCVGIIKLITGCRWHLIDMQLVHVGGRWMDLNHPSNYRVSVSLYRDRIEYCPREWTNSSVVMRWSLQLFGCYSLHWCLQRDVATYWQNLCWVARHWQTITYLVIRCI